MNAIKKINPTSVANAVFVLLLAGIVVFGVETYRNQARYMGKKTSPVEPCRLDWNPVYPGWSAGT